MQINWGKRSRGRFHFLSIPLPLRKALTTLVLRSNPTSDFAESPLCRAEKFSGNSLENSNISSSLLLNACRLLLT